jgi:hypothetical protein
MEKQEHTPARLISDATGLLRRGRLGQQQIGALGVCGGYQNPSFSFSQICVFYESKPQRLCVESDCLIVVPDDESDVPDSLCHGSDYCIF